MLIVQLPTCFACGAPASRWRVDTADKWGYRKSDGHYYTEEEAYAVWDRDGAPDNAYGTCGEHFYYKRDEEGNIVLTAAGRRALAPEGVRKTRKQTDRKHELRLELISKLGGECEIDECEESRPPYLQIYWTPGVRPAKYSGLEWLRFLARDGSWANCVLRCVRHPYATPVEPRKADKEAAIAVYGGQCDQCGETDSEVLRLEPDPGTQAPRYPGGRKMGSRDKYRWLRLNHFPGGWSVRCAPCAVGGRVVSS